MNWRETQAAFASALRDPALDVPYAVGPRDHHAPLARFNVYRNNTAVSLSEAIADSYPVVHELVGDEFFAAMARAYVEPECAGLAGIDPLRRQLSRVH